MGTQLPKAVRNLRRLWDEKKTRFEINQVDAAKKLGWTQGAFSQYLNNITELNTDAVVKLANFLEVDPHEIDPDFSPLEPNRIRVPVVYVHPKTPEDHFEIAYRRRIFAQVCEKNHKALVGIRLEKDLRPIAFKGHMVVCSDLFKLKSPSLSPGRHPEYYVIKRKNSDPLEAVRIEDCPPDKELEAKLLPFLAYIIN